MRWVRLLLVVLQLALVMQRPLLLVVLQLLLLNVGRHMVRHNPRRRRELRWVKRVTMVRVTER